MGSIFFFISILNNVYSVLNAFNSQCDANYDVKTVLVSIDFVLCSGTQNEENCYKICHLL